jgi:P27 family predicted phage terminase small subunit
MRIDLASSRPPPFPAKLRVDATRVWREFYPVLAKFGLITLADRLALYDLCMVRAEIASLERTVQRESTWFVPSNANGLIAHPAVALLQRLRNFSLRQMVEFGLTPASRVGIGKIAVHDADSEQLKKWNAM